ncbi:hypothetical protein CB1_000502006 [Camelus ferus]|nr:hypothetical protein CB1_000502006 [Camelus ferus]
MTLPVDAAAVPPGSNSDPSHPPPPLCVSVPGVPWPDFGRRAGVAGQEGPRRPRREIGAVLGRPGARPGEGTSRADQGLGGQHFPQRLWTSAWSERFGFVAAACCGVDTSLILLPSLPASGRLVHRVSEVSEKAWKGRGSQMIGVSNAGGAGPVNDDQAWCVLHSELVLAESVLWKSTFQRKHLLTKGRPLDASGKTSVMDQRKNESIVPSITQLEDFLTEHNSNVVWLLVGFQGTLLGNDRFFSKSIINLETTNILKTPHFADGKSETPMIITDPKAETRLYITVNDFEFHVYNRSDLYGRLQELFGLEPTIIPPKKEDDKTRENGRTRTQSKIERVKVKTESQDPTSSWRSLIPVIKVNVSTGRLAFGNHYQPQTLCINFDDAFLTYTTKPPSSHLDQFMHIVKGKLENVRVMLVPSPRYVGLQNDEPPRLMGEGFVVMQSNDVDIYYYMDEPGYTPAIKGQLLHVDATTSMQYRTLLEAEMLAFHINASYPRIWNMPQTWQCELEVYKATYHFIFAQKNFFTVYLAACGETLNIDFSLPFTDFVPATCNTKFSLRHGTTDGPECPTAFLERLCFEMKKGFRETMLQLVLSPLNVFVSDNYQSYYCFQQRPPVDEVLREGHINLSGLQLRAHAMFSAEGLPLGSDSLEYAWLIDVQAGSLTAKVTAPQMGAIRVANCNLHNQSVGEGISAAIQDFQVRQYIEQLNNSRVGLQPAVLRRAYWLEAGSANLGLITVDIALAADHHSKHEAQRQFLETHDTRTKRLWFLWPDDTLKNKRCRNKCGCLGGCRFFGGTVTGLDFFKLEELTPSSSSAFSSTSAESDMYYGQSLLQPGEWIITKEVPKIVDGNVNGMKRKEWENKSVGIEVERKTQHLSLQVPLRSHSSSSSSEENSSSSAAQPLLAGEKESPSSVADDHLVQKEFLHSSKRDDGQVSIPTEISGNSPVSPNTQDKSVSQSLRSPLKRQASVCSTRLGSTKSLTAAFYGDKQPVTVGVQFSSDVSRSDENVLDSPKQRRSFGSFPYTPSADSNSFHQYRSMDSSMSMADSEAYFSAAEEFEPISSDEGPGTYPGRKKKKKQAQQIDYSRGSIYHSVEGPLTGPGESIQDARTLPFKTHPSQASFVSALGGEDDVIEHLYVVESEKTVESEQITSQQPVMNCYQTYLTQFQVINWSVKHPANKRTSKSSLHRPLDLDTPTSEESSSSFEQLSVPTFKVIKQGLTANSLLDRGMQLSGSTSNTPYTPLDKKAVDNTDDETLTEEWTLDQPVSQTRTTAIVEVKGTVDIVLTPLVAEALDRYIEAMVHCASTRHPAAIVDDLHVKVLREAVQNSKTTFSENVNLCLLQASVEESPSTAPSRSVTHVSLVALCFDRIATQVRMNRGVVEETSNNADPGRTSNFDRYVHATKMQPQSSGSLRSNAGAEKGKEIAAKLNIHRVHGQLRGLDTTDIGTCAITAIPFEKSKVLFTLEELDEFAFVDETDQQAVPDITRIGPSQEKWGWIMFECGLENLTIKGGRQSGAVLYNTFGIMGKANVTESGGVLTSNNSSDSPTGSGYNTDVSDDNLPCDRTSPSSDLNGNSVSDEQNKSVHFPLRSKYNRLTKVARFLQENPSCLLCNILHHYLHQANYSIIDDATMSDGLPALVTLKKGLVALARQWMKFIVVTPAFKGVSLHRPAQPLKPQSAVDHEHEDGLGLDNGGGLQSDTSADGAEFEFDADFNTVLSSDQNTLDGTHSQHSTSQDDVAGVEEANQGFPAVQLADAQVVFKPLLSHTGIQSQDAMPLCYRMYFGEHLSFSGTLDCLRADIVDSDTAKERKGKRARRQGQVNLPPLEFKPALMLETFSISAVVMEKSVCTPQNSTSALSFHDLNKRYYNTFHCNFTISCQSISQHVDMALVRLIHQFSTMIDDIKATQTDIKLSRYTAGSASPTPTFKTRKHRDFRSSDFSRSSRGSLNGGNRVNNAKNKRTNNENNKKESRNKNSLGRSERRTSKVSRKGSKDVVDHMTIHMDDSDSITVSEQRILEKSSETFGPAVFGIGMVNRTHLEADIGGLTMESELKRIHGSFTLKEKMKDVLHQKMTETCATAHIGGVNIVLLEGITPNIQTVVKCSIAKSQALYSAQRGLKTNNAAVFKVGAISINIPQHPATLHSMMVRSSHQLSKQISDLIRQPSTAPQPVKEDIATPLPSEKTPTSVNQTPVETNEFPQLPEGLEKKPIVLKFSAMLDGIAIGAALLPSLKAEYKMGRMRSHGMTGKYIMEEHDSYSDQVGSFEHNLTTDLLNHLVFVQKVFMKEVNEVIQKVSGGEQPIPLWNEHDGTADGDKPKILLYSLNLQFKVYEEAGSDFHQVAYFKTRIGLRNALREEISGSSDREAVLITLNRPIVYAQPVAFDRAVLFWLNYKAAYDNWNEQRMALHKDIHMATKEVVDMLPGIQQTSAQAFGTLFLQLTVNDLGICLPITNTAQSNHTGDLDTGSALVLTIESTLITACSSESLVSKGHFKNFCIRFADGFETSWDDWKPEIRGDLVMNACVVPDGTYEVCSRTTGQAAAESSSAGTWTLNVLWKMCGIDVHMDPNIGKRLNALGNTLTTLTGEEDIDDIADLNSVNIADLSDEDEVDTMSPTIHTEAVDYRRQGASCSQPGELRGRKIMKRIVDIRELNEQAKVIDDLKKLGASEGTINQEIQRYQQLESVAVNDIRRDVRKKLRRSSMRAASLKDKWGLGYKPSYSRSKSISASGRPPLKRMERASSRVGESEELPEIRVDAASPGPRVTFNIQDTFPEETELDLLSVTIEGPSNYSSNSEGSYSMFSSPKTPGGFTPGIAFQPEEGRRDDSSSSTSEDSEKDEKDEDHERERFYIYRKPSHTSRKKATGFAAVHQLFTERWPTAPVNRSLSGTATERNIDFELDIRVEIDSGKCVLHPTTLLQEHDDISLRSWTTSGLKSQGRLSVGSNRDREISMSVGLGRSQLDSKGGVVGGTIDVNALEMVAHISEHPNQQPSHKIQITMGSTEARVDYMGSSILMGIFSNADLKLQDEWKVNLYNTLESSMTDKSEIFVHGDLKWDIFQVMISRSTTPDLIKIGMKLQEFFTQQFDTSKRALSTWGPVPYLPPKTVTNNLEKSSQEQYVSLKPKVECSVVTEFTDHICVTMDAELIMFLHDLVSAYLKEKEKGQKSPIITHDENSSDKDREDSITYTTVDWRDFMCNTWHLEPTLRTTIPKWLQRGVMDPLDKVLSVLIKKLGTALQDEKEKKGKDKEEH